MKKQVSDSIKNSAVLALSGGFQDAYTYNLREQVFANAQTGNVVLFSQNLMTGNVMLAFQYLIPIFSFTLGVMVAESIRFRHREDKKLHWRQRILITEIVLLFIVGFLPNSINAVANALVSFTCAMQVQSFRTVNGHGFASTMCIGNIRSGTEYLSRYIRSKHREDLSVASQYFGIIIMFAVGAGIGGILSLQIGFKAIWFTSGLLLLSFFMMRHRDK